MSTDLREINGSDSDESRLNPLTMSTLSTRNNSISLATSIYSHPSVMTRSLPGVGGSVAIREFDKRQKIVSLINESALFFTQNQNIQLTSLRTSFEVPESRRTMNMK